MRGGGRIMMEEREIERKILTPGKCNSKPCLSCLLVQIPGGQAGLMRYATAAVWLARKGLFYRNLVDGYFNIKKKKVAQK